MAKKARSAKQKANDRRLGEMARARAGQKRSSRAAAPQVTVIETSAPSAAPLTIIERGKAVAKRGYSKAKPYLHQGKLGFQAAVKASIPSFLGGYGYGRAFVWLSAKVKAGEYEFLADKSSDSSTAAKNTTRNVGLAVALLCAYAATKTKGAVRQALLAAPAGAGALYAVLGEV
jgi:hypothetical protein